MNLDNAVDTSVRLDRCSRMDRGDVCAFRRAQVKLDIPWLARAAAPERPCVSSKGSEQMKHADGARVVRVVGDSREAQAEGDAPAGNKINTPDHIKELFARPCVQRE